MSQTYIFTIYLRARFRILICNNRGTRWDSWLRHYATSRKVEGLIPDEITGFFNLPNPSSRTMALGSTQPLIEMSTRNLPGGKWRPAPNLVCQSDNKKINHNTSFPETFSTHIPVIFKTVIKLTQCLCCVLMMINYFY
jgi:hypothetical protein